MDYYLLIVICEHVQLHIVLITTGDDNESVAFIMDRIVKSVYNMT